MKLQITKHLSEELLKDSEFANAFYGEIKRRNDNLFPAIDVVNEGEIKPMVDLDLSKYIHDIEVV